MTTTRPDFLDSPFFVMEPNNWHLREGAPPEVVREFEEYEALLRRAQIRREKTARRPRKGK